MKIFGIFHRRRPVLDIVLNREEPRIISSEQLQARDDVRVGDLIPVVGGCPRFPGDTVDVIGPRKAVVCEFKGELYYRVLK